MAAYGILALMASDGAIRMPHQEFERAMVRLKAVIEHTLPPRYRRHERRRRPL